MSWQISIQLDQDQDDVGSIIGVWTDPDTNFGDFTFSQRIKADKEGVITFMNEAIAARDQWQKKSQIANDLVSSILISVNMTDSKVIIEKEIAQNVRNQNGNCP